MPKRSNVSDAALDNVVAHGAVVPSLWRWEVQDVLRRLRIHGRLLQSVDVVRAELHELPIVVDDGLTALFGDETELAARYNLTVYDAAYRELAVRLRAPLATNDAALAAAAKAAKLPRLC